MKCRLYLIICLHFYKCGSLDEWGSRSSSSGENGRKISSRCDSHSYKQSQAELQHLDWIHTDCSTWWKLAELLSISCSSSKHSEVEENICWETPKPSRCRLNLHSRRSEVFLFHQQVESRARSILADWLTEILLFSQNNFRNSELTDRTLSTSSNNKSILLVLLPVSGSLWTYCFFGLQHGRLKILSFSTEYDDSILRWSQFSLAQQHPMTMTVQIYLLITTGGYYNIVTGIDQCQGD